MMPLIFLPSCFIFYQVYLIFLKQFSFLLRYPAFQVKDVTEYIISVMHIFVERVKIINVFLCLCPLFAHWSSNLVWFSRLAW